MTGGNLTILKVLLYFSRQIQEPKEVRDVTATFTQSRGHFFLSMPEFVHQLAVSHRLFNRIQICALDIFDYG